MNEGLSLGIELLKRWRERYKIGYTRMLVGLIVSLVPVVGMLRVRVGGGTVV